MGGVREDVEASGVVGVLIAGEPDIAFFRDEADQQYDHGGDAQTEGSEQHKQVSERVQHPNSFRRRFAGRAEGEGGPQLQ